MSGYGDLLTRLDEAHVEEQEFNKETYGERYFDPEEGTLYKDAAAAIRELTAPKPPIPLEFGPLATGARVTVLAATGNVKAGDVGTVTKFDRWIGEEYPYIVTTDDGYDGAFTRGELRRVHG